MRITKKERFLNSNYDNISRYVHYDIVISINSYLEYKWLTLELMKASPYLAVIINYDYLNVYTKRVIISLLITLH